MWKEIWVREEVAAKDWLGDTALLSILSRICLWRCFPLSAMIPRPAGNAAASSYTHSHLWFPHEIPCFQPPLPPPPRNMFSLCGCFPSYFCAPLPLSPGNGTCLSVKRTFNIKSHLARMEWVVFYQGGRKGAREGGKAAVGVCSPSGESRTY